ncbi:uncharacterized protein METZ01_LOCUS72581 [marine metagenome]|uniref:Protein Gp5 N-terminal OB-fold domain-containing protein n=1 Tax=marine metagenome TaxID=408172 RepID=A0A381TXL7_9ZZZZ
MSDFMGQDGFVWFIGVVEDREDPEKIGRVRVRCLGYHTEDKSRILTADLPWATVMAPTDTPSMNGLGNTPPFIVEGSWVLGFFRDQERQQPIILGTLPGFNTERADSRQGFFDPKGRYPKTTGDSDVNLLARGSIGMYHPARIIREQLRLVKGVPQLGIDGTSVPTATKPNLKTVSQTLTTDDTRINWEEPQPAGGVVPQYPFNHTHESEIGHVHEVDDTPGAPRLLKQHIAGTFEEIHPDGTKVTKVVKDNYEIVMGESNVYIMGNVNLTTNGNMKHLVKGDYVLEVEGDYFQKIHKNQYTKVGAQGLEGGGNREEEILGSHGINIANAVSYTTGTAPTGPKEVRHSIGGNFWQIILGTDKKQVNGGDCALQVTAGDYVSSVKGNVMITTTNPGQGPPPALLQRGQITLSAGNKLNLKSGTSMNLKTDFDGLNIDVEGFELTNNSLLAPTGIPSIFNLTVAGAANWTNTGAVTEIFAETFDITVTDEVTETFNNTLDTSVTLKVTETFSASQQTNITGDLDLDTTTGIDIATLAGIDIDSIANIDIDSGLGVINLNT